MHFRIESTFNYNKILVFSAAAIIACFGCHTSSAQEKPARTPAVSRIEREKNSIRRIYNRSKISHKELVAKIKRADEQKHIEDTKQEIAEYYNLARTLEKRGEYLNASYCYEAILRLSENDRELSSYIRKRNKELQQLAKEKRTQADKRIRTRKKELETPGSQCNFAAEKQSNLHKMQRPVFLDELEERIGKLEQ